MGTIFEYISEGPYVRVAAIDEKTGTEAIVITPTTISKKEMQDLAFKKLKYVMEKQLKEKKKTDDGYY